MGPSYYKYCKVPECTSTSIKTPNKLFIYVPNNQQIRKKWLTLARRNDAHCLSPKSRMYFCEDHFDLPNDMLNYTEYHIMGKVSQVRTKPGCIPRKFACQEDRRKRTCSSTERPYVLKKQRMTIIAESLKEQEESCTPSSSHNAIPHTSSGNPIVIKEELNISPEVVYVKSEPVENEDGYESNKCEDRMSIQVELDVVKVEEDLNPQQNIDYSNIPTKPEESQSKDIKIEVPNTKEAYILLEDCMKELQRNNCYCRNCKTLFPSVDALEIHNTNAHSLLIPTKRYKFKRKISGQEIIFYKQAIEKVITNNEHNYAKTRPTNI